MLVTVIYAANQPLTVDQRIWVVEKCHQIKGINLTANAPGSGRISELFFEKFGWCIQGERKVTQN